MIYEIWRGQVEKEILQEYTDACELVKETEQDIRKLKQKKRTIIQTNVKGSNPDFPYQGQHFRIQGMEFTYADESALQYEEKLLEERKIKAQEIKLQVEEWMNTVPMRMQRIIRYKFFEGLSWEQAADRMGRKATGDSVRKELQRFMEEI